MVSLGWRHPWRQGWRNAATRSRFARPTPATAPERLPPGWSLDGSPGDSDVRVFPESIEPAGLRAPVVHARGPREAPRRSHALRRRASFTAIGTCRTCRPPARADGPACRTCWRPTAPRRASSGARPAKRVFGIACWARAILLGATAVLAVCRGGAAAAAPARRRRRAHSRGGEPARSRRVQPVARARALPPALRPRRAHRWSRFSVKMTPRKRLDVAGPRLRAFADAGTRALVVAGNDMGAGAAARRLVAVARLGRAARTSSACSRAASGSKRWPTPTSSSIPPQDEVFGLVPLEALLCGHAGRSSPTIRAAARSCRDLGGGQVVPARRRGRACAGPSIACSRRPRTGGRRRRRRGRRARAVRRSGRRRAQVDAAVP